ncbi:MAG: electron transfer flavoprotein subunit beta/FixA family protein [Clostridia bacterium]|nr:electron transfer flavoprotein subunit beta/FixA family protein [Clostridia bacterium]
MSLKIAVCIKPVPDPDYYDQITIDPVRKTITRAGIPTIINPVDKNALEAALQIKEQVGGTVTVITMAPPNGEESLREMLAMGADEACLLTDRAFGGADTLATSYTLAQGLKKLGNFDLVFTGTESADGATSQVPSQLAEWLGMAHLWNVSEIKLKEDQAEDKVQELQAKMKIENGYIEYEVKLPAVLAVSRDLNTPRFTSIMGVMKAKKKPLTVFTVNDVDVDRTLIGLDGSPTKAGAVFTPSLSRKGERLTGDLDEVVEQLLQKLRAAGINLEIKSSSQGGR